MENTIAKTIWQQLGGNKFAAMTGAKVFSCERNSLVMRFARANNRNAMKVTLDADDTYTVVFYMQRGGSVKEVSRHSGIYADMLEQLFTDETGLATRL